MATKPPEMAIFSSYSKVFGFETCTLGAPHRACPILMGWRLLATVGASCRCGGLLRWWWWWWWWWLLLLLLLLLLLSSSSAWSSYETRFELFWAHEAQTICSKNPHTFGGFATKGRADGNAFDEVYPCVLLFWVVPPSEHFHMKIGASYHDQSQIDFQTMNSQLRMTYFSISGHNLKQTGT